MVHNSYGYITCLSSGTVVMDRTFRPVIFCKLEPHSGLSFSFATTTSSIRTNTGSVNTITTSPSSSSKRWYQRKSRCPRI